jgi:hypothetical protein
MYTVMRENSGVFQACLGLTIDGPGRREGGEMRYMFGM